MTYQIQGFLDKNRDTLFTDLMQLCLDSGVPILNEIFLAGTPGAAIDPGNKIGKGAKKRPVTAGFQFKVSTQWKQAKINTKFHCSIYELVFISATLELCSIIDSSFFRTRFKHC